MSFFSLGERVSAGVFSHVLYAKLLKDEEMWQILMCDDVPEILEQLAKTLGYKDAVKFIRPEDEGRVQLESRLKIIPLEQAKTFLRTMRGKYKHFLVAWIKRYEASALKRTLRYLMTRRGNRENLRMWLLSLGDTSLPFDLLLSSRDFSDAFEALKGTIYEKPLKEPLKRLASGEENMFHVEMAIDTTTMTNLFDAAYALPYLERRSVLKIIGLYVDLTNVMWIYRGLRFYDLTPEQRLAQLLPRRYKFTRSALRALARSSDVDDFWGNLETSVYGNLFEHPYSKSDISFERDCKRAIREAARRVFRAGRVDFATVIAYLTLLEYEIGDLCTIIEDVRYDYDRRQAALYLIRPLIPEGEIKWPL